MIEKLKSFFLQSIRVWHVLKKPNSQEFKMIAKVSLIGVLAIGLIGFFISVLMNIFK